MNERSDEALMYAYAKGDMAAFEHLYARYRGPLYRYILSRVGDSVTANDLYQGSWEKLIRARKSWRATAPFKAWLFRIAHNHLVDHLRRARPMADVAMDSLVAADPGPQEQLLADHRQAALAAAIESLPEEQKEALLLKLEAGLDLQTIADVTGVGRETAKSRLRYAVDRLQNMLGER
jgi:RNA polymerase sigma-70 factor (ECF subfamily)